MIKRHQAAEDRLLPNSQADTVSILQGECGFFVAWSMYSRQRTYASRIAGDALPTAKQR